MKEMLKLSTLPATGVEAVDGDNGNIGTLTLVPTPYRDI